MGGNYLSKPILYKSKETNFAHLGLGVLADETETLVTEERNGQLYLTMKYPMDGVRFEELKNDRLIKVSASPNLNDQRFKIIRIRKLGKGLAEIYAEHISNETEGLQLKPEVTYSGNAETALNIWKSNIVDEHPFSVYSDIPTVGQGKWLIDGVENARQALGGVRGSILDTYGGEYRFDNYRIGLYQNRGVDNGLPIMYGKNLMDLEQEEEIANTYTSLMPYATYRPENADADDEDVVLTLPEYFVDSKYVDNYARRKILKVNFSDEEVTTESELRKLAKRYIEDNEVGVPKVNLRVKFIDLAKTLDYKDIAKAEEINLCDWITVYFEKLGIKTKAKVIKTVWNPTLERYEEIEIGETRASLSQSINDTVDGKLDKVESQINRVQTAANGKNRIFRGPDDPTQNMQLNDLWYRPVGDGEVEMYRYTGEYWKLEKISGGLIAGELDASSGDLDIINMNANNITANRGNFVMIAMNEANSSVTFDGSKLRYTHSDGGYTQMSSDGFKRFDSGTGQLYHHLVKVKKFVTTSSGSTAVNWIGLGPEFNFLSSVSEVNNAVSLSLSDTLTGKPGYEIQRTVVTQGHTTSSVVQPRKRNGQWEYPVTGYVVFNQGTSNTYIQPVAGILQITA